MYGGKNIFWWFLEWDKQFLEAKRENRGVCLLKYYYFTGLRFVNNPKHWTEEY